MDTERSTRKPVNSEKDWLIFAVRELSRVVTGKEKGQEQLWSNKYKPEWWDSEMVASTISGDVKLTWKNPTTNPKDTKNILILKYKVLCKRQRTENKFPETLEAEVDTLQYI